MQGAQDLSDPTTSALPCTQSVCASPAGQSLLQAATAPGEPAVAASPFTHASVWYWPDTATAHEVYCVLSVTVHAVETYLSFAAVPSQSEQLLAPADDEYVEPAVQGAQDVVPAYLSHTITGNDI